MQTNDAFPTTKNKMKTTIIVLLALLAVSVFFLASADSVNASEASLLGKGKFRDLKRNNHRGRKNRGLKKRRNFGRKHRSHKRFGGVKTLGNRSVDLYGKRSHKKNRKYGRKNGRKFRKINRKGRKNRKVGKNRKSRKNRKVRKNRKNRKIGRKFRNKGRKNGRKY